MNRKIYLEICVESVDAACVAESAGSDRIELCSDLLEGGLTPGAGIIKQVISKLTIPVNVMIRPRTGDFCYSDYDFEAMKEDVKIAKASNANGVVLGILKEDFTIDEERTQTLIALAKPMNATFHRAFDLTPNPFEALETLINLGVDRVLTSGQEATAYQGIDLLKKLVEHANNRIVIMPGGGINETNVKKIVDECGVSEIHSSASVKVGSKEKHNKIFFGKSGAVSEHETRITSAEKIKAIIKAVN
jgi:copper homeostasis protein